MLIFGEYLARRVLPIVDPDYGDGRLCCCGVHGVLLVWVPSTSLPLAGSERYFVALGDEAFHEKISGLRAVWDCPRLLAAVFPYLGCCFDQAASAAAFRFLLHPSNPNPPRPVTKRGRAVGRGAAVELTLTLSMNTIFELGVTFMMLKSCDPGGAMKVAKAFVHSVRPTLKLDPVDSTRASEPTETSERLPLKS